MKRTLVIAGSIVLLLAGAALILPMLVEVDAHRSEIEGLLARSTGREATLRELSLHLLPAPTLHSSGITLGEDPAFGEKPFLEAESLTVRVALLPLLAGRLEVGLLTIKEPLVRLHRRGDAWNLASLLRAGAGPAPDEAGRRAGPGSGPPQRGPAGERGGDASGAGSEGAGLEIRELLLTGGRIRILDEALPGAGPAELTASEIDLRLEDLAATKPIGIDGSLVVGESGRVRIRGKVGPLLGRDHAGGIPFETDLSVEDFDGRAGAPWLEAFTGLRVLSGRLGLDARIGRSPGGDLRIEGDARLSGFEMDPISGGGPPVKLDAEASLAGEIGAESSRLTRGDLRVGGASLSVTGSLLGIGAGPRLEAAVRVEQAAVAGVLPVLSLFGPFVPRGLGPVGTLSLDVKVGGSLGGPEGWVIQGRGSLAGLELRDPSLTEPVRGITGAAVFDRDSVSITGFGASLGSSRVEGSCAVRGFDRPEIRISLGSPRIDLDEILGFIAAPEPDGRRASEGAAGGLELAGITGASGAVARASLAPADREEAPSVLACLRLHGDVTAAEAKLMNLKLTGLRASLEIQDGKASIQDARLGLYGGAFEGRVAASLDQAGPPFEVQAALKGVDFDAMVTDFSPDLSGLLFGTLEAGLALTGAGLDSASLRENLEGTASFALVEGRLTSVGVLAKLAEALESAGGRGIGREETPFSYLGGNFKVRRGKARTGDLRLESPDVSMRGEGSLTMDMGLDLDLKARLSPEVTADMVARRESLRFLKDDKERIRLDLKLGGTLAEPKVGVDPEMIRRVLKEATREHLKEKAAEGLLGRRRKKSG